jgi:hypothetical protein
MARNQVVMPGFAAFHLGILPTDRAAESDGDAIILGTGQGVSEGADVDGISE